MIRIFRKLASRWYINLPLCSLLLFVSCNQNEIPEPAETTRVIWSGQQLFKGLFLMDGPVADRITTYATLQDKYHFDKKPELQQELSRLGERLVLTIEKKNPSFFSTFQRSIQSGDHLRVTQAMEKGSEMLQYAIQQDPQYSQAYATGVKIASKIDLASVTDQQGQLDEEKLNRIAKQYLNTANDSESSQLTAPNDSIPYVGVYLYLDFFLIINPPYFVATVHASPVVGSPILYVAFIIGPIATNTNNQLNLQREMIIQEITEEMAANVHLFENTDSFIN